MSGPPIPRPARSTGGEQTGDPRRLDYLPLRYADLLALEDRLAVDRLGRALPQAAESGAEPDVARTFMELSALVAHVLAVYQRQYAAEAYLSTAQAASSLVRHARALAYEPDPGLAATGHVVLTTKDGVAGTVAAGLALASVPLGEQASADYETREDVAVDAALNELRPAAATRAVVIGPDTAQLRLEGRGHGLAAGDVVAFVGPQWRALVVQDAVEEDDVTRVVFDRPVLTSGAIAVDPDDPPRLLAHPARVLRPFGASADPALYPPGSVQSADARSLGIWFEVGRADGGGHEDEDVYLAERVEAPVTGAFVLRRDGATDAVLRVTEEVVAGVTLRRRAAEPFTRHDVTVTEDDGTWSTTVVPVPDTQTVRGHVAGTVTAIRVTDGSRVVPRAEHPFPADWLTGWTTSAGLAATEPNPEPLGEFVDLPGEPAALAPGRPLVFTDEARTAAEVVTIRRAEGAAGVTRVWWDPTGVGGPPSDGWRLDTLVVLGNVARVSHGRAVAEVLGGSDGVTAFQRFPLKQSPVTVLPGVAGGEPALEIRVDDVRWSRVQDFYASGPDDRHFRAEVDERGVTTVVFGDGHTGAVPPSGVKNVRATYRVGLGRAGDLPERRLSRLKRAHPLLARAENLTPIAGGADPADPGAIRVQATRHIRTFDRAVSTTDLADLALTMPGIARAAASWDQSLGAVLVVATSTGDTPPALDAVRAFLDARRDVSVPLTLRGPVPRDLRIVVDVEPDPAYLTEVVKQAVRDALHGDAVDAPGLFTFPARDLAQPAFRSEVYAALEALPGVVGARVTTFQAIDALGGSSPVLAADVVSAGGEHWLRLKATELTVTVLGSAP